MLVNILALQIWWNLATSMENAKIVSGGTGIASCILYKHSNIHLCPSGDLSRWEIIRCLIILEMSSFSAQKLVSRTYTCFVLEGPFLISEAFFSPPSSSFFISLLREEWKKYLYACFYSFCFHEWFLPQHWSIIFVTLLFITWRSLNSGREDEWLRPLAPSKLVLGLDLRLVPRIRQKVVDIVGHVLFVPSRGILGL